jgi:hypothetical protein
MRSEKLAVLAATTALAFGAGGCGISKEVGLESSEPHKVPNSPECTKVYNFNTDEFGPQVEHAVDSALNGDDPNASGLSEVISDNADCFGSSNIDHSDPDKSGGIHGLESDDSTQDVHGGYYRARNSTQEDLLVRLAQNHPIYFAHAVRLTDDAKEGKIDPDQVAAQLDELARGNGSAEVYTPFMNRLEGVAFSQAKKSAMTGQLGRAVAILTTFSTAGKRVKSDYQATDRYWLTTGRYSGHFVDDGLIPLAIDAWDETVLQRAKELIGQGQYDQAWHMKHLVNGFGEVSKATFRHDIREWEVVHRAVSQMLAGHMNASYSTINRISHADIYNDAVNRLDRIASSQAK